MQGQKAAVRPGRKSETQTVASGIETNVQVPQSLKHPQKGLDHSRLPLLSKGKFLGFLWDATCIPWCPYMNP